MVSLKVLVGSGDDPVVRGALPPFWPPLAPTVLEAAGLSPTVLLPQIASLVAVPDAIHEDGSRDYRYVPEVAGLLFGDTALLATLFEGAVSDHPEDQDLYEQITRFPRSQLVLQAFDKPPPPRGTPDDPESGE